MDQQVAVGMHNGVGQLQEERQPTLQRRATRAFVDRLAVDELQHEVGQAVVAGAGTQQPRDVRVRQPRQGLALQGKERLRVNAFTVCALAGAIAAADQKTQCKRCKTACRVRERTSPCG